MEKVAELLPTTHTSLLNVIGAKAVKVTEQGCRVSSTTIWERVDGEMFPIRLDVTLEGGPDLP